ncbi:hypothetical protein [Mycobacterium montefiorense]|uniref:Uncharacterized protein n=1 Tax=Mycobacterium montefiorense TaxID=154654 RepID=A0AA37PV60_9MYCO|nr:hypothetical protein [Mycobacterium montefiorense]GBG35816.1 hypothetical protein MmonteBS_01880 [Mycobacterium montefiorense]GKU35966.1 hypothetical protein NJB14191_33120 [Mycobacterium montefiorense]GKU41572.1 hypothetical protein NJB14192_35560 [Mycobacterium montefiorense]GKU44406.1 hypothetical protein NJB14194_10340 [Mycobacterium montefiorense]GKU51910.1 hypothetical protein NJB14195_31540 [Mycobacterium montefiorense]
MVVYGEAQRPRVVVAGFDKSHPFASVVERYAGTVHYLDENPNIRWDSWDAVVAVGFAAIYAGHVRVLQIGGDPIGGVASRQTYASALSLTDHIGEELEIPDRLPDDLRELVKRELIPLVDPQVDRSRISPTRLATNDERYLPLLHDLDGYAFAALYLPPLGIHACLYLPGNTVNLAPWLLYAFRLWSDDLPDIFPSQPEWTSNPTWMTAEELSAQSDAAEKRAEEQRVMAEQRALVEGSEASLAQIRERVDASERQLLTADGPPLVAIVHQTLEEMLEFEVTNVDDGLAEGQAKKEDLRVADDGWIALCEVKGYTRGAKLSDLQKLTGWATLYAAEAGRPPNAMWFVANQFRGTDPSTRQPLLQGAEEYLEVFGQQGGLAIDTRDLFRLRKAVASGSVSAEDARAMLMGSTGRFEPPPTVRP